MPTRQSVTPSGVGQVASGSASERESRHARATPSLCRPGPVRYAPLAHRPQSRGKPQQDQRSFGQTGCREPEPTARRSVDDLSDQA